MTSMVVVFGSINIDLVTRVERLPLPGQTMAGRSLALHPGGKGANQALAARRAGADVYLFGAIGQDAFARSALALLAVSGVELAGVRECDAATGSASIWVDDRGENCIAVVPGANALAEADWVPNEILAPTACVILQQEIPVAQSAGLALRGRRRGARILLNAAPPEPFAADLLPLLDYLVVNEHEANVLASLLDAPPGAAGFAKTVSARTGGKLAIVVTRGAQGAIAFADGCQHVVPAPAIAVVDTTAAGDAFIGAMAAALDRGASLADALRHGVASGTLACTIDGAQPSLPVRSEIEFFAETVQCRSGNFS